jgi:hypothetical protein
MLLLFSLSKILPGLWLPRRDGFFKGSGIDNVVAPLAPRRLGRRAEAEKVIASIRATPNITRLSPQSWALEILAGQSGRELALPDSPGLYWIPAIVSSGNGEGSSRISGCVAKSSAFSVNDG